ncbi:MAG: lipoate--protein ligase [Oscillospiraceae bacterium]|nr:lipoate--protein ligase [Oscillospiraceae bacterium]
MVDRLYCYVQKSVNPYENLALEAFFTSNVQPNEVILYLWQNKNTVVIGKNQNPWKECRLRELEQNSGVLSRRLSGGGAVFHDMGNLNFTFIAANENYSIPKQMQVVLKAVQSFGVNAELSGRNDITADGKKFSGNAFYNNGTNSYHHGTLLVNADMEKLSAYLNVSASKLSGKGVDSVKSRVTNLNALCGDITIETIKSALKKAFGEEYGFSVEAFPSERLDEKEIAVLKEKFSSWDWCFGRKIPFDYRIEHRFSWGEAELQLAVDGGKIKNAALYSDAMEWRGFSEIAEKLKGCEFSAKAVAECLQSIANGIDDKHRLAILNDLKERILQEDF